MVTVVVLHWLSVVPHLSHGKVVDRNVVDLEPGLWPLTWVGDVMALFFFAGGYANWVSLEASRARGESGTDFVVRRMRRLLGPTFVFFGLWLAADLLVRVATLGRMSPLRHVALGNTIPFGPLWFLGVYVVVVATSPWTVAAHRRWRRVVPLTMVAGVAVADLAASRLDSSAPLAANLLLVWLVPHQLGYFYADGTLRRLSPVACAGAAAGGLVALAVLTSLPFYSRSLIDHGRTVLGIDAPTLTLVAAAAWLVGLALLVRQPVERLLDDPRRWRLVSRANGLTMPVYLWHMTAYLVALASLAGVGAGFGYATRVTGSWWWGRPVVVGLSACVLVILLGLLRRAGRLARANRIRATGGVHRRRAGTVSPESG
jgi:fucose 4-O-acetylase-like acetyltransferase